MSGPFSKTPYYPSTATDPFGLGPDRASGHPLNEGPRESKVQTLSTQAAETLALNAAMCWAYANQAGYANKPQDFGAKVRQVAVGVLNGEPTS